MEPLIAHPGHWIVTTLYFVPVVGFLGWLAFITVRDRRARARGEDPHAEGGKGGAGSG